MIVAGAKTFAPACKSTATPMGFEPTRAEPIGLAGRRLKHSAKVSWEHQNQCPSPPPPVPSPSHSWAFASMFSHSGELWRWEWPLVTNKKTKGAASKCLFFLKKKKTHIKKKKKKKRPSGRGDLYVKQAGGVPEVTERDRELSAGFCT